MRKFWALLLLCVLLSGCSGGESSRKQKLTPLPYEAEDNAAEIFGKSLINLPVWTLEGILFVAYAGIYLCALSGFDPSSLRK